MDTGCHSLSMPAQLLAIKACCLMLLAARLKASCLFLSTAAQCKVVLTCDEAVRGGRSIQLKATVDAAVRSCPSVRHVLVSRRTGGATVVGPLDVPLEEVGSSAEVM